MPEQYVVDASVAAKWFLNDETSVQKATDYLVRLLADEILLHAPTLLRYEFGNILTRAQRQDGRPIDHERSLEALEIFHEYPITYHELGKQAFLETLTFANQLKCSFQDSSYLWLARSLNCRLLTADIRFVQNIPPDILRAHIQSLGQWAYLRLIPASQPLIRCQFLQVLEVPLVRVRPRRLLLH
ncbi:MAG: type II toxin-antitoxin system VapC family toxin [Desulfomonile tiedjei]|nr:type II toxin-antitoxin system VapC family toxin [Desulfomonile tiedjei]